MGQTVFQTMSTTIQTTTTKTTTKVIPMIWEMEITEKQKRKEEKRIRRQERRKRKGGSDVVSSSLDEDDQKGCGAPVALLSRGIQFDRSERINPFPAGTRLILRCNDGAKPFPKERAKCKCKKYCGRPLRAGWGWW